MELTLNAVLFYLLAAITAISALAVVVTGNIVRSATWLLFALAGVAGVFFLLEANFIGATQLLIYVGGTLVLVVFGVMLTAQGPFINMRISAAEWLIALVVGVLLYGVLAVCVVQLQPPALPPAVDGSPGRGPHEPVTSAQLGAALLGSVRATPEEYLTGLPAGTPAIPRERMTYLLPFEIVSIHLLVVLIGAAYLARAKKRHQPV
jgi:NADH-quinone oxidoreductase subunit J